MPKLISKQRKETSSEYKARKIRKYTKRYNLDKIQVQELKDNNAIEIDGEELGTLIIIKYNEDLNKFIIQIKSKPIHTDYMGDSDFESNEDFKDDSVEY